MTVRNVYQTKDKCTINVTRRSEIFTVKLIYLIICQIVSMFGILGVMCNSVILCAKIIIHNNSDMYLVKELTRRMKLRPISVHKPLLLSRM